MKRNPLNIALGAYFSTQKKKFGKDTKSKSISDQLKIGESLYRMIESGNARLHPKNALKFIEVFSHIDTIDFGALCKFLFAAQFIDAYLDSVEALNTAVTRLKEHTDEKVARLIHNLEPLIDAVRNDNEKEIKQASQSFVVIDTVRMFLSEYDTFAIESQEFQSSQFHKVFTQIPTMYFEFIEKTIDNLKTLPMGFRKTDLWKWEESNQSKFEFMFAFIRSKDKIIDAKNLENYQYKFLWEPKFREAHLVFAGNDNPDDLKKEFIDILKPTFPEDSKYLSEFDDKMKKIHFYSEPREEYISKILEPPLGESGEYKIVWIFGLETKVDVGLMSRTSGADFTDFISLDFENTQRVLANIKSLI